MGRRSIAMLAAAALGCGAGVALGGCGGQTNTTSVAGGPGESSTGAATTASAGATTTATSAPAQATTGTSSTPASEAGGTSAPSGSTRTATAPAFIHQESQAEGLAQAVATLRERGYTPAETSQYHADQTLRVLVGTKEGAADGYDQQAFFFVDGRYIGTDTKEASARVDVLAQSDTEVTLSYPLYRAGDPLSSPSAGTATVRFQLNDGKLTALDPIPPANSSSAPSRR